VTYYGKVNQVKPKPAAPKNDHSGGSSRIELWFAIAAGATYGAGMVSEYVFRLPTIGLPLVFFIATYIFGGFFTIRTAIASTLRGQLLPFQLIDAVAQAARKLGYERYELSWVLEDNLPMRRICDAGGARIYKTYRVYEKALSGNADA